MKKQSGLTMSDQEVQKHLAQDVQYWMESSLYWRNEYFDLLKVFKAVGPEYVPGDPLPDK